MFDFIFIKCYTNRSKYVTYKMQSVFCRAKLLQIYTLYSKTQTNLACAV